CAHKLDCGVDRLMQSLRDLNLRHRYFAASLAAAIERTGRVHREKPTDLDRHSCLANQPLHALMILQVLAETHPLLNVGAHDLQRPPGHAEPTHAMREPRGPEPYLRDLESLPDRHQSVLVGNFQSVKFKLAMAA